MAARKLKSWPLKPQPGTPLNWDHPLARFLINRWAATEGAGTKLTDSAGRANGTTSGTWTKGPYGPMVAYNGSNQAGSAVGVKYKSASTLTVAFTYYRATNPNTYNMIMESSADLGSNFNGSWNIWDGYNGATNTQGNYITVSIAANIAGNQVTSAAISQPVAGVVHRIVATIDRRLTTNQITAIYVDGVLQTITYGTPVASKVTVASTFTDYTMYFAARGGSSFYNNCRLDDVVFSTRLWTQADAVSDYANRYGMYVPPRLRIRSSPSAGTTATIAWTEADDVTAIAVTSSSTAAIAWTEQDDGCAIEVTAADDIRNTAGFWRRHHAQWVEAKERADQERVLSDLAEQQAIEVSRRARDSSRKAIREESRLLQQQVAEARIGLNQTMQRILRGQFEARLIAEIERQIQIEQDEEMIVLQLAVHAFYA